jgi:hypothetical protein
VSARTFTKFPYRTEFPGSSEQARNSQTLEDALSWARWVLHAVWREDTEYGGRGEHTHPDAETAVITNRNTGYRWILRRKDWRVEFQTPAMVEEAVAEESVDIHLTFEEAEALARAARSGELKDRRQRALLDQALDQMALVCRQVRERVLAADEFIDSYARGLPRRPPNEREVSEPQPTQVAEEVERPRYRPLGDPDNLSLKEAGEILGKARNTVYLWYKQGKFPPAVDVAPYISGANKPVIVVPPLPAGGVADGGQDAEPAPRGVRASRPSRTSLGVLDDQEGREPKGRGLLDRPTRLEGCAQQGRQAPLRRRARRGQGLRRTRTGPLSLRVRLLERSRDRQQTRRRENGWASPISSRCPEPESTSARPSFTGVAPMP